MPELPEVETVARSLSPLLHGQALRNFHRYWPRVLANISLRSFQKITRGSELQSIGRRAKFLVLDLRRGSILIHLRMTGKLYFETRLPRNKKHLSAAFLLEDGRYLLMEDQRHFGRIYYFADTTAKEKFFERLGPDPLEAGFTGPWLRDHLSLRSRQIKPLLLDQSFIAGLGNIYTDEALWYARLHPLTPANAIKQKTAFELQRAIRKILRQAIAANGTTFMDFRFLGGKKGGYTEQLLVFRRTGMACRRCKNPIIRIRVSQRASHLCPHCQPLP